MFKKSELQFISAIEEKDRRRKKKIQLRFQCNPRTRFQYYKKNLGIIKEKASIKAITSALRDKDLTQLSKHSVSDVFFVWF